MSLQVWLEILGFLPALDAFSCGRTHRLARHAEMEVMQRRACDHLEETPLPPSSEPHIEQHEVEPAPDYTPRQVFLLHTMLQSIHPCISITNGHKVADLPPRERRAEYDAVAAIISGSFPLRHLEWDVALSQDSLPVAWTPNNINVAVLAPTYNLAIQFAQAACRRIRQRLGCPQILMQHGTFNDTRLVVPIGTAAVPPPLGNGLPCLSFAWRCWEQLPVHRGLRFLPPHQSDLSVCRVAMWVGADGKWVLEYPNYVWHDVDERVFPLSLSPVSVSDARRTKYRERGYTEVHQESVCVSCGLSCTRMWRGGCRRLAPFRVEWWEDDDPRAPVLLCGSGGVRCGQCRHDAGDSWCPLHT